MAKSSLISDDEHNRFSSLYNPKCKILGVAVSRLYISTNNEWKYIDTGLAALLKDNDRRNYFLQLVNMDCFKLSREFEIIWSCKYEIVQNQIHTFNGTKDLILLSFADLNESMKFESEIKDIISTRNAQRQKKRETAMSNQSNGNMNNNKYNSQMTEIRAPSLRSETKLNTDKKGKRGKINKSDISNPTNFQHLDHMGLNGHFFENPHDENLLQFLKLSNLDKLLDDDKSKKEIYDFVESHGGFTKLENEMKQKQNMERKAPSIPKASAAPAVPAAPAAPGGRSQKPPPPPPFRPPTTQTNQYIPFQPGPKPSVPQGSVAPPPPPPPAPPPPAPSLALPVPSGIKPQQNKPIAAEPDSRGGLLNEITKFDPKKLKASSQNPRSGVKFDDSSDAQNDGGSILKSLAAYLQDRQTIMAADNSDSDSESESDEEWDG